MASSFTWLDASEHDRQKMMEVVRFLGDQGTVDELGIGTVRDAFADLLHPGTSTIQTRARYFLFVPWFYQQLEKTLARKSWSADDIALRARKDELRFINALVASEDAGGTIGVEAGSKLKRLPSNIYWQGLHTWGIRLSHGAQSHYHRQLSRFGPPRGASSGSKDDDRAQAASLNWHPGLPLPPEDFPTVGSFALRLEEAAYLRERILSRAPRTLLAFFVDRGVPLESPEFPWDADLQDLPAPIAEQLLHARNFSEALHGAALLYNLLLARMGKDEELTQGYEDVFDAWAGAMGSRSDAFSNWDRKAFWVAARAGGAKIPPRTVRFIDTWLDLVGDGSHALGLRDLPVATSLLRNRERCLKGEVLARLWNLRARELWKGASGTTRLSFRWGITQNLVNDIAEGLAEGSEDDDART